MARRDKGARLWNKRAKLRKVGRPKVRADVHRRMVLRIVNGGALTVVKQAEVVRNESARDVHKLAEG